MPDLRILGGVAKGRALKVPESARPTGARLRKSLFDLLAARFDEGAFLDLYGGSGAVGLEAASRGYAVTLIDKDKRAVKTLEDNARALGLDARVLHGDALALLPRLGRFDLVFLDPPYEHDIAKATRAVLTSHVVADEGTLVVQHPVQLTPPSAEGWNAERRVYGSNVLTLYTRSS
ncbi:RsmD family RNA methyltransferase [Deinococcus yavapaiensis]|uniref:16S rRNA (Guanine(966)-N(2))-methyltransferase RsmD n=1 Tax=Deinococcus yavapaiensis KR-236 TaxID=694435 RepID=A0A318SJE5_9DEIO|nr:RsmD family RNA methyltransferase [Deinococcus yavapaiensis]PYE54406.1 16S rRNA (guanine(966)-N(2))-methyltransferase RsmD [Deinococcus yavapaiensis KR-236]